MKNKKVLIRAFVQENLGDDLFIKILTERYPDVQFYIIGENKYKNSLSYLKNLKYISGDILPFKILNYIYMKMPSNRNKENNRNIMLYNILSRFFAENVYITGSFFIESPNWSGLIDKRWYDSKPVIIGCNFGPFITNKFYDEYREQFKKAKQVSFRDKYSYNLFPKLENIEYHPDIIFNLEVPVVSGGDYYIISVVNIKKDVHVSGDKVQNKYIEKMRQITENLCNKNNKVVFVSFCSEQGDEQVIQEILKGINDKSKVSVNTYSELGMNKILELIAGCKGIVATRFHAMILGFLFGKNTLPIVYNEKMKNVIEDLDYTGRWFDINDMSRLQCSEIDNYFGRIDKQKLQSIVKESEKHFHLLDNSLK